MISLWAWMLCRAIFWNSPAACAISLARISSSERARSSISGATRSSASNVTRERIPRRLLSFNLLRLNVKRDILSPDPGCKIRQ